MQRLLSHILFILTAVMYPQEKVYFLDGTCKTGKISEISSEVITLEADETVLIPRDLVLLLEFRNGSIEIINKPSRNVVYNSLSIETHEKNRDKPRLEMNTNLVSLNTLALCNSDISGFYEHIFPQKKIGLGFMAAYNFNAYSSLQNIFIAVLTNAKKKYDVGLFGNFYLGDPLKITTFHLGILLKYMRFDYSKAIEEKVISGNVISTNIKYTPASGSQLATIFTCGTHTQFTKNIFVKSIFGLGGFNLKGDYKQQYNYFLNKAASQNPNGSPATTYNRTFLLKLYFGLNIGYNF